MCMKHPFLLFIISSFLLSGCELAFAPGQSGNIRLISIGLNYEQTDVRSLNGTINDATELAEALRQLYKDRIQSSVMVQTGSNLDDLRDPLLPTKDHVLGTIEEAVKALQPADLLIISYSGHGLENGSWVLAPENPHGHIYLDDETIDPTVLLSVADLMQALSPCKATVLVIGDSCYAGSFVQENPASVSLIDQAQIFDRAYSAYWDASPYKKGLFVITATTKDNTSKEPIQGNHIHGYFTQALLSYLGWNDETAALENPRTFITLDDMYHAIHENQHIPTEGMYPSLYQHPAITGGAMDLVLYDGES